MNRPMQYRGGIFSLRLRPRPDLHPNFRWEAPRLTGTRVPAQSTEAGYFD